MPAARSDITARELVLVSGAAVLSREAALIAPTEVPTITSGRWSRRSSSGSNSAITPAS